VGAAIPQPSTADDLRDAKHALRAIARERRRTGAAAGAPAAALAVRDRFLAALAVPAGTAVSAYWPLADELDPRPLMAALDAAGAVVALPVIAGRDQALAFRRWRPGLALVGAVFGTSEPPPTAPTIVPGIVIVPLLAFDRDGYRLGYGAGYYDRTLKLLRARGPLLAVGVAFAAQEVAHVPHGPGDERLDWVVTERAAMEMR
jgi:5-formyltetrahydrofolate cyclo-ligase